MIPPRFVAFALAASIVAPAPALAQGASGGSSAQSPFFGSVSHGDATGTPLALSMKDTLDRALQFNLGLLLREESLRAAHGARWRALSDLLPKVAGTLSERRQVINLPVGIASLVMTKLYIFDPPYLRRETKRIDYWGIGLLALWVGALQLALDLGQERDWFTSPFITVLVATSLVGVTAFLIREWVAAEPVIDLRVFKIRSYSTGVFLMTTLGFVLYGSLVLLPIMLQTLLGYPSLQAGIAMAPRGMGSLLGMPIVGILVGKIDARKLVVCGLTLGAGTLFWLGQLNLQAGYWDVFWPQFLQGIGLSLLFVPLTTISMDAIPRERMGNATSLFSLMRNLGGSVGIAVTGTLLLRKQQVYFNVLGERMDGYSQAARSALEAARQGFIAGGADPATALQRAYAAMAGTVQRQAAMLAFVDVFRVLGTIFLVLLPLVFLMKRPRGAAGH